VSHCTFRRLCRTNIETLVNRWRIRIRVVVVRDSRRRGVLEEAGSGITTADHGRRIVVVVGVAGSDIVNTPGRGKRIREVVGAHDGIRVRIN